MVALAEATKGFRGIYAAASLKHQRGSGLQQRAHRFRGIYAAASLKR